MQGSVSVQSVRLLGEFAQQLEFTPEQLEVLIDTTGLDHRQISAALAGASTMWDSIKHETAQGGLFELRLLALMERDAARVLSGLRRFTIEVCEGGTYGPVDTGYGATERQALATYLGTMGEVLPHAGQEAPGEYLAKIRGSDLPLRFRVLEEPAGMTLDLGAPDVLLHPASAVNPAGESGQQFVTLRDAATQEEGPFNLLRHHALSGVGYGYSGSGAADLALNILALHLPVSPDAPHTAQKVSLLLGQPATQEDSEEEAYWALKEKMVSELPVELWDGRWVSWQAWYAHQDFKVAMISHLDQDGAHVIRASAVRAWLRERFAANAAD